MEKEKKTKQKMKKKERMKKRKNEKKWGKCHTNKINNHKLR